MYSFTLSRDGVNFLHRQGSNGYKIQQISIEILNELFEVILYRNNSQQGYKCTYLLQMNS